MPTGEYTLISFHIAIIFFNVSLKYSSQTNVAPYTLSIINRLLILTHTVPLPIILVKCAMVQSTSTYDIAQNWCYKAVSNGLSSNVCVDFFRLYYPQKTVSARFQTCSAIVYQYNKYIILTTLFSKFSAITFIFFKSIAENFNRYLLILNVSVNM